MGDQLSEKLASHTLLLQTLADCGALPKLHASVLRCAAAMPRCPLPLGIVNCASNRRQTLPPKMPQSMLPLTRCPYPPLQVPV